jgi:hypothetical protein
MDAVAVAVHLGGKIGEFLPALELGAVVERHHDELRWAVDARVRRHGVRQQQSQRGNECPRGQFSPPTESNSESLSIRFAAADYERSRGLPASRAEFAVL